MENSNSSTATLPLVSVIMPSHNTCRFVRESIESVLTQDYPNKELIVVDDGSTDETLDILRSYGDRIKLLTQRNLGAAAARNHGIAESRGDLIAFLDSDDIWLPGKLTVQVLFLENHPHIGAIYARWREWVPDAAGEFQPPAELVPPEVHIGKADMIGTTSEGSGWLYNRLLFTSLMHTITVMVRRSVLAEVGVFDESLKRGQDYDLWLRISRVTPIYQIDRVFALYRIHGSGCVTKYPDVDYEQIVVDRALCRWGLAGPTGELTPRPQIAKRLWGLAFSFGYRHFWNGDAKLATSSFRQAVSHYPWSLKTWGYFFLAAVKSLLNFRMAR